MNYTNISIKDFIHHIIKFNNISEILDTCNCQAERGFIFERLFDIVIKFGFCDRFSNLNFFHIIRNVNNGRIKILENLDKYLEKKVISGNSTGCSDITLQHKITGEYIFITSKIPKSEEEIKKQKSVEYYDIQNILAMAAENKHIYKKFQIYLAIANKKFLVEKVKKASITNSYITKYMTEEHMLDKEDLNEYFLAFKESILENINKNWQSIYIREKEKLILRFHQELITQKTSNLIQNNHKSFLWGCKCRSGKTFMIGGIINKQFEIKKTINVLIITPAPTETAPQFTEDLFNKFEDFNKFKIHHIDNSKKIEYFKPDKNNIFVFSKQLLQKYTKDKTITKIKNLNLDIIAFDENHYGGVTELSKDILESYSSINTTKIYLTATFQKPLKEWNISQECQMFWDIEDEQICKSILKDKKNIEKLKEKHGEKFVNSTLEFFKDKTIYEIFKPYEKMPDLYLMTNMFDQEKYENIKKNIMGSNYGFSFDVLFSLNLNKIFRYQNEIELFLKYISGSEKESNYKNKDKTIFGRIESICSRKPFVQIWFLPSDNINVISENLKKKMLENNNLKDYRILCINRKNNDLVKDVRNEIIKEEIIARSEEKKGLILLAGNMLNLGITIKSCDLVILMNNTLSSDKVIQQMYRCMSEDDNKKMGFVVDLNISRVLQTCINHTIYKNNLSVEDKIKYIVENNLINIDSDLMILKKLNSEKIVLKLMEIWKDDPVNNFKTLLKNLDNDYVIFDNPTQKLLNNYFMNSVKENRINSMIELNDNSQNLPSGKVTEIEKNNENKNEKNEENKNEEKEEKEEKKEIKISFTKDVLPFIIPLTCILTIENKNKDFINMLKDIKENKELLEIFDDQCLIWWNKKDLINIIRDIVINYFDKSSNTYNISIQFKMSIYNLLDRPKDLLELISDCLKPKVIEKRMFGEVFTPMNFINDKMLKDIEKYWEETYKENIWSNDLIKWYDPAAGMGNYPIAIFYKLMEGLTNKFPNEIERKKHIIEKQLFMAELNKKNCFIMKQIFNIHQNYKLNLYEGDSLKIDIKKTFNVDKFDIIIGNPPYNEELKTKQGSASPLYNKFIEYYIDKCNLLSFIVPSRWFAGGKGLDNFRKMMINRTDIVFIKHFDDACKIFGNMIEIKGGVNYFLIDHKYNDLCNYNNMKIKLNNFDVILDNKYYNLITKMLKFENITKIYISQSYYKIQTNDKRLIEEKDGLKIDKDFYKNYLKCYVSQQKGFIKYIKKTEINKESNFFKVIVTEASFGANSGFGNIFIGYPYEIYSGSYISFKVSNENEAKSLLSYMKLKLSNFLLSLRKASQHTNESTCKWIPLPPLDRIWNDEEVYKYFKLDEEEIKLIKETKIKGFYEEKEDENLPKIIKDGRRKFYLIEDKVYKIKKDKTLGKLFGSYVNNKIIEEK